MKALKNIRYVFILAIAIILLPTVIMASDILWFTNNDKVNEDYKSGVIDIKVSKDKDGSIDFINGSNVDVLMRVLVVPILIDSKGKEKFISLNDLKITYFSDNINSPSDIDWRKSSDGYFYYKHKVNSNEVIDNKFIKNIDYKLKQDEVLTIDIIAEGIQYRNEAYKYVWQK